ncbi:MAG: hypothetical protein JWN70_2722 [Planctomycetaceae bacterium]|nr:hypothetical protein [Planctomycetaceae bacterium]
MFETEAGPDAMNSGQKSTSSEVRPLENLFPIPVAILSKYPDGVMHHSPGLPAPAGYPGCRPQRWSYPERVAVLFAIP